MSLKSSMIEGREMNLWNYAL